MTAMRRVLLLTAASLILICAGRAAAQSAPDREGVRQAVLDYVEGVYDVDPSRIERSVHPNLTKHGFFIKRGETAYSQGQMTFTQLVELSKSWNKERKLAKDAPKEITVFDVLDQTATAKLVAAWGIDYFHLAKFDGRWKIINIVWQTHPKKGE
jgi:hypothetical protein